MEGANEDEGKELGQWSGGKKREEVAGKRTEDGHIRESCKGLFQNPIYYKQSQGRWQYPANWIPVN